MCQKLSFEKLQVAVLTPNKIPLKTEAILQNMLPLELIFVPNAHAVCLYTVGSSITADIVYIETFFYMYLISPWRFLESMYHLPSFL
jgi:hypothetical protein